jgi:hypothetical protein
LVREIIDIDSSYIETENGDEDSNSKRNKKNEKKETNNKLEKSKKNFNETQTQKEHQVVKLKARVNLNVRKKITVLVRLHDVGQVDGVHEPTQLFFFEHSDSHALLVLPPGAPFVFESH